MVSTIEERLLERVRMELGDLPQPFDYQFVGDGVRDHFYVEHRPFDEATATLLYYGDPVDPATEGVTLDGTVGMVVFDTPPDEGSPWELFGMKWRYFSDADLKVTRDLIRAGQLLKLEVLDHVIVTPFKHCSLRELGSFHT